MHLELIYLLIDFPCKVKMNDHNSRGPTRSIGHQRQLPMKCHLDHFSRGLTRPLRLKCHYYIHIDLFNNMVNGLLQRYKDLTVFIYAFPKQWKFHCLCKSKSQVDLTCDNEASDLIVFSAFSQESIGIQNY